MKIFCKSRRQLINTFHLLTIFNRGDEITLNKSKHLPLTETTFYILTALLSPGHGYYIMQKVEELSLGRVRIAAGTMYGAIENLLSQNLITPVPSPDKRRKLYQTTALGRQILASEADRLRYLVTIADRFGL